MNEQKRHRYVGYEGTCMDCHKDLHDAVHITDAEHKVALAERERLALMVRLSDARQRVLNDSRLGFADPPALAIDKFIAEVLK